MGVQPACVSVHHVRVVHTEVKENVGSSGTGYRLLLTAFGCRELDPCPLEKHPVLLIAEPSFQLHFFRNFKCLLMCQPVGQ